MFDFQALYKLFTLKTQFGVCSLNAGKLWKANALCNMLDNEVANNTQMHIHGNILSDEPET